MANLASKLLSDSHSLAAEDVPLFLPSSLSANFQSSPGFSKALAHEIQLRIAQADDALADIRHHLRIISGLWRFKKVNISGTGNKPNTRMRSLFNRFNHRMRQSVLRYRAARSALLAANLEEQHWKDRLKDLKDSDVRGPGKDDFYLQEAGKANYGTSKGRFEMSWIWLVPHAKSEVDSSEQVFDEGLRVEWSKSQARKMRWEEEVQLIQEEMRRPLFTMNGRNSGGSNKIVNQQLLTTRIPFSRELQHIHKSKHIIASVWPRVLLWLGYPSCSRRA